MSSFLLFGDHLLNLCWTTRLDLFCCLHSLQELSWITLLENSLQELSFRTPFENLCKSTFLENYLWAHSLWDLRETSKDTRNASQAKGYEPSEKILIWTGKRKITGHFKSPQKRYGVKKQQFEQDTENRREISNPQEKHRIGNRATCVRPNRNDFPVGGAGALSPPTSDIY